MAKEKVLITGGSGYLGNVLTGYLLDKGYEVTCLDNLSFGQRTLLNYSNNPKFKFVYGDARDKKLLEKIVPEFEVLIPLAAVVGAPACDLNPINAVSINYDAVKILNDLRTSEQKFIFPSTISVYGSQPNQECTEETIPKSISLYGKTKIDVEEELAKSSKDFVIFRFATVFGVSPRMRTDLLVNDFVLKAIEDGSLVLYEGHAMRNYVNIRDTARVFEYAIQNYSSLKNNIYNVGMENNFSKLDLATQIKNYVPNLEIINREIKQDVDKRDYKISSQKLKDKGFCTEFSLEDGVKEIIRMKDILLKNHPYKNI
jgi:nucleoside-diphosphate-sugar epimerase